jgi:hypothetical protein
MKSVAGLGPVMSASCLGLNHRLMALKPPAFFPNSLQSQGLGTGHVGFLPRPQSPANGFKASGIFFQTASNAAITSASTSAPP